MFVAVCQLIYVTVTVYPHLLGPSLKTSKNILLIRISTVTFHKRRRFVANCGL